MTLSYKDLLEAVAGAGVGVRARTPLEPLGGPDDKVFPPTYSVAKNAETAYALEQRRVAGVTVEAAVLDSVQSQANHFEAALLEAHRCGEMKIPLVTVDFREDDGVEGLDRIGSLEAPHRIFDAILRDSLLDGMRFPLSDVGASLTEASSRNAAALFRYAPHTLVLGGWDSTGPRGGRGAKYERALTSEIVAIGVVRGKKTSSRIDPLAIEKRAGPVYEAGDGTWTLDPNEAVIEKDEPKLLAGNGEGERGRPSQINHGNIAPSIDERAGGVTADRIHATTVLSFVQLRRLRFPLTTSGTPVPDARRRSVEAAGHATLAALGLAATVLAFEEGFDLRSRCVLYASEDLSFELIYRGSKAPRPFTLDRAGALALLESARAKAAKVGLEWELEEVVLRPCGGLVQLIRNSQEIAATAGAS